MSTLSFTTLSPSPDTIASRDSPLWRIVITNIAQTPTDFEIFTTLDKLADDRVVTPLLNAPLVAEFTVPSDNPQVYIPAPDPDSDPYVSEGTRLAFWFRRESETAPYYTIRASTLIMQVEDTAQQDDARTRCVCYDPWQYLMNRRIVKSDGSLPGENGLTWTNTRGSDIALDLLAWSFDEDGPYFIDTGSGTVEDTLVLDKFNIPQGTYLGQALQMLTNTGTMDIIMRPVYDPTGFATGDSTILCELNIYVQAGQERPSQVFAWNMPGRSLTQISRMQDGTGRANVVKMYAGQGGAVTGGRDVPEQEDVTAVAKYRPYHATQFLPGQVIPFAVEKLAEFQLELRKNGRETVTMSPAPERSPRPFQDYELGDRVPVWASANRFRQLLGAGTNGTMTETQFVRIYGFPINIDNNALEQVGPMILGPGGFAA